MFQMDRVITTTVDDMDCDGNWICRQDCEDTDPNTVNGSSFDGEWMYGKLIVMMK